ncbi:MAG TPA: hypothetical protein PLU22_07550 [Polyangiaceae bacterium]|nr:hypothetical protein [Polyangiaceae bacterium]
MTALFESRSPRVRAYYFDAAGNHVVLGMLRRSGITPEEALGILRGADRTPLAEHPSDVYCILYREHGALRARFFNPDGSREDLCGNALRCVPFVLADRGEPHERVPVHTGVGVVWALHLGSGVGGVEIPTDGFSVTDSTEPDEVLVGVGTPHRVRFVADLEDPALGVLGRQWSRSELPVAATFVKLEGTTLCVRSFERGVPRETGSSGTAAIAACVAEAHRAPDEAREFRDVRFPGAQRLRIRFDRARRTVLLYGACRLEFCCDLVTEGERLACSG